MATQTQILVVNDTEAMAERLIGQLNGLGYENCTLVHDGVEALSVLSTERPDLVLSDVAVSRMDGFQLCRVMRSIRTMQDIPVLLLSATYREFVASRLARQVRAQGFVHWPCASDHLRRAIDSAIGSLAASAGDARILIADDDEATRRVLMRLLERANFDVIGVPDGLSAIETLTRWEPHLVLCDYWMPGADGREVLSWCRTHRPAMPLVIMTAHGSERLAVEMMRLGAYDYVTKPLSMKLIVPLCRAALERHNLRGVTVQFEEVSSRLSRSERRYRALFEHAAEAIFVCDDEGRIREVNRRAASLSGFSQEELVGHSIDELIEPAPGGRVERQALVPSSARGDARSVEGRMRVGKGAGAPVEVSVARVPLNGDSSWLVVVRDLSDRKWVSSFIRSEHRFLQDLQDHLGIVDGAETLEVFLSSGLRSALDLLSLEAGAVVWRRHGTTERLGGEGWASALSGQVTGALFETLLDDLGPRLGAEYDQVSPSAFFRGESLLPAERLLGLCSRLEVPLRPQGEFGGLLILWSAGGELPEAERALAAALAAHLGMAIENAELLAQVSRADRIWERTFEVVDEMVAILDADDRVVQMNPAMRRRLTQDVPAPLGQKILPHLFQNDEETEPLATARAELRSHRIESAAPGLGAGTFVLKASPMLGERGRYEGATLVVHDITAERTAQQQILLTEKMATIGRMAAAIAHEINNPLAFLSLNLTRLGEMMEEIEDDGVDLSPEIKDEIAAILSESSQGLDRVRDITGDLRLFTPVRKEENEEFDLNDVVDLALTMTRHELRHKARVVRDRGELPATRGEPTRIGQVVTNLLMNAAEAITDGHVDSNEVRVVTRYSDGSVILEVSDTGSGIDPVDLPRVFDPFYTTKEALGGTGMGLSISLELVKRHGGEIDVQTRPGHGTLFRVSLPAVETDSTDHDTNPRAQMPLRARLLLVDDETRLQRAVRRLLHESEIHAVSTGREAIATLQADRRWDLVLCDVTMPDLSGLDVYRWVRDRTPELCERFVFITGGIRAQNIAEALAQTGRPILNKPLGASDLREAIRKLKSGQ